MTEFPPRIKGRPLIAISMKLREYSDWVQRAGGSVQLVTDEGRHCLDSTDGLLLTGGEDIDPALYGKSNRHSKRVNRTRDNFELNCLNFALERGIPVLGVCRGMQLINVALGGKLYQDLSERDCSHLSKGKTVCHRGAGHTDTTHEILIRPNTILSSWLGKNALPVNSHHHQGIDGLPSSLRASASALDGLIEAFEGSSEQRIVGVQWHPERWPDSSSAIIMQGFLARCLG